MGALLWQEVGAPGCVDGQVGTSHLVHAPSRRPRHATTRSRAVQVPALVTIRCMIPWASLSRPLYPEKRGAEAVFPGEISFPKRN